MAYREVSRVEIAPSDASLQSGISQRQIATGTGLSRAAPCAGTSWRPWERV